MRVEVEVGVGAGLARLGVVVHGGGSPQHGEGECLGVHPGVDEAQARRPLRRPPPQPTRLLHAARLRLSISTQQVGETRGWDADRTDGCELVFLHPRAHPLHL